MPLVLVLTCSLYMQTTTRTRKTVQGITSDYDMNALDMYHCVGTAPVEVEEILQAVTDMNDLKSRNKYAMCRKRAIRMSLRGCETIKREEWASSSLVL